MTLAEALSENDLRILRGVESCQRNSAGLIPHGSADWSAIRRLCKAGLVTDFESGSCETCPDEHEAMIYVLTEAGRARLELGVAALAAAPDPALCVVRREVLDRIEQVREALKRLEWSKVTRTVGSDGKADGA